MNNEIILTPEELYFMGRLLQAKYIDYAYVAAMNDINQNFALFENEARASLVSAGILTEDFSGNTEIEPSALSVLKPIFFGEVETSIDICSIGEKSTVEVHKYHFYDGAVTEVTGGNGNLIVKTVDQIAIREQVESLISEHYIGEDREVESIDMSRITRFIAFKQVHVGNTSIVKTYIEAGGVFYRDGEDALESVTRDRFISDTFRIVKGV